MGDSVMGLYNVSVVFIVDHDTRNILSRNHIPVASSFFCGCFFFLMSKFRIRMDTVTAPQCSSPCLSEDLLICQCEFVVWNLDFA